MLGWNIAIGYSLTYNHKKALNMHTGDGKLKIHTYDEALDVHINMNTQTG